MEKKDTKRCPVDVPLECYGVEQREGREMCVECHFQKGCAEFMGRRFGRIPLSAALYDLKTIRLQKPERIISAYSETETSYATAHRLVFKSTAKRVKLYPADADSIQKVAAKTHCTVLELCLTLMGLWAKTRPELPFRPKNLLTPYSVEIMQEARRAAVDKYAGFCSQSVADLVGVNVTALKEKLRASETRFGTYIVRSMCKKPMTVEKVLRNLEYTLDPTWLALEDAYADILENSAREELSPALRDHRHSVVRVRGELMQDERLRHAAYRTRSEIMPAVMVAVLGDYGLSPKELEVTEAPITDTVTLWKRIADIVKHLNTLRIYGSESFNYNPT